MKYLLDTHTFLWWDSDSTKLSSTVQDVIKETDSSLYVSLASVWEIQIKSQLEKLTLPAPLAEIIERQHKINRIELLAMSLRHVLTLDQLPQYHRDPFDRILIAQAISDDMTLISRDPKLKQYAVAVLW